MCWSTDLVLFSDARPKVCWPLTATNTPLTVISFRTSLFYNSFLLTGQRISSVLSPSSSSLFLFVGNEEMCFYYSNVRRKKEKKKKSYEPISDDFFQKSKVIGSWWHGGFVGKSFYFKWNSLPCSYWPFLWLCRTLLLFCYRWNIISKSFYSCVLILGA